MIDPNTEIIVALAHVPKDMPPPACRQKPHVSCIYRWTNSGCRGVILESIQIGGTRCTSKEALGRFFRRLTDGDAADTRQIRSIAQRGARCCQGHETT